ncbi:MAG: cytochrome c family protein [Burkholderiales bacterium]
MTRPAVTLACTALLGVLATEPSAQAAPDASRGEAIYARCQACHALAFDRVGPRHCGLFGRRAGSVPGFHYSVAMKQSTIVWTAKSLDRFLTAPMKAMPGTAMTYDGVPDRRERADLIAYLKHADESLACHADDTSPRARENPKPPP